MRNLFFSVIFFATRKGVKDMITWSETQQVPVLVFSAGLGESVLAAMKAANFLLPHVKVYLLAVLC